MQITFNDKKVLNTCPLVKVFRTGEVAAEHITITGPGMYGDVDLTALNWTIYGNYIYEGKYCEQALTAQRGDDGTLVLDWVPKAAFAAYSGTVALTLAGSLLDGTVVVKIVGSQPLTIVDANRAGDKAHRDEWQSLLQQATGAVAQVVTDANAAKQAAASAATSAEAAKNSETEAKQAANAAAGSATNAAASAGAAKTSETNAATSETNAAASASAAQTAATVAGRAAASAADSNAAAATSATNAAASASEAASSKTAAATSATNAATSAEAAQRIKDEIDSAAVRLGFDADGHFCIVTNI